MTPTFQAAILAPCAAVRRSLTFRIAPGTDVAGALRRLRDRYPLECGVFGIGAPTVLALGRGIEGLRTFPALSGAGIGIPSTQEALCFLLSGPDRGVVFDWSQQIRELVGDAFVLADANDTFTYHGNKDLTRFEDGTENPKDDAAIEAAIREDGSSFLVLQRWVHDLVRFRSFASDEREMLIGRREESNEEIEDAPDSAHVKRSAQESYDPPAFMVRRSMPWANATQEGLEFVAHVESLDRYERVLERMVGHVDGIVDGLFAFSRPVTGGYYWCPPVAGERIDLALLGL